MKLGIRSLVIGTVVTLALFGVSYSASVLGLAGLSHITYWQGWWLQTFIPCMNIGTLERPMCEGAPLNIVVFFLGLPFGVVMYSLVALIILVVHERRVVV